MAAAIFDQTPVDMIIGRYTFRSTGSVLKFAGFTRVYEEGRDDAQAAPAEELTDGKKPLLPKLTVDEPLDLKGIDPKQHFTEPPPRYTEASLVRVLEENGIGRPSTYSSIVETIQARGYVEQIERRFHPTDIGIQVNDLRAEHFKDVVDPGFTAPDGTRSRRRGRFRRGLGRRAAHVLRQVLARAHCGRYRSCRSSNSATNRPTTSARPAASRWSSRPAASESSSRAPAIRSARPRARSSKTRAPSVPKTAAWWSNASQPKGPHVLRLRQLPEVRLRLVGPRRSRTVPGLRRLRRRENEARRRGLIRMPHRQDARYVEDERRSANGRRGTRACLIPVKP